MQRKTRKPVKKYKNKCNRQACKLSSVNTEMPKNKKPVWFIEVAVKNFFRSLSSIDQKHPTNIEPNPNKSKIIRKNDPIIIKILKINLKNKAIKTALAIISSIVIVKKLEFPYTEKAQLWQGKSASLKIKFKRSKLQATKKEFVINSG